MKWVLAEKKNSFALFPAGSDASIASGDIAILTDYVQKTKKNGRLCLHKDEAAAVHQMVVCEQRGKLYPPHRHLADSECFQLLSGRLAIVHYSDDGIIEGTTHLQLGAFYKAPVSQYHSVFPLSDLVVYYESKGGPYEPLDRLLPDWYPRDLLGQTLFNDNVRRFVRVA